MHEQKPFPKIVPMAKLEISNSHKKSWTVSIVGISITQSYLTFSPFEDLVSQELMVVVDIGLHLLLHSRPRYFSLFSSFFLHQIMWVFGSDHLCWFKCSNLDEFSLSMSFSKDRILYELSDWYDSISSFLRKQVKSNTTI